MSKTVIGWAGLVLVLVSCSFAPKSPDGLNVHTDSWSNTRSAGLGVNHAGIPVVVWTETWQRDSCIPPPCSYDTGQFAKQWDAQSQSWKLLDSFSNPKLADEHLNDLLGLEFDRQDRPYLVQGYSSSTVDSAKVWHWSGTAWEQLGDPFTHGRLCGNSIEKPEFSFGHLSKGTFSIGSDDFPVLGWLRVNQSESQELWVYRWDGGKWVTLGSSVNPPSGFGLSCSGIRMDSAGNPVVAWARRVGANDSLQVARWTGSEWANIGEPLLYAKADNMFYNDPQLQLDSQNRPLLALVEQGLGLVKVWDGTMWSLLGESPPAGVSSTRLELDPAGRPVLATSGIATTGSTIQIRRWNSTTWEEIGTLSDPDFKGFVFAINKDNLVLTYLHGSDQLLHARVFNLQ